MRKGTGVWLVIAGYVAAIMLIVGHWIEWPTWEIIKLWQGLVGSALTAVALVLVTLVTLDAENRHARRVQRESRKTVAFALRHEVQTMVDRLQVVHAQISDIDYNSDRKAVKFPIIQPPFPAMEGNSEKLGLLDGETLEHLLMFYEGWHIYDDWREELHRFYETGTTLRELGASVTRRYKQVWRWTQHTIRLGQAVADRLQAIANGEYPPPIPEQFKRKPIA